MQSIQSRSVDTVLRAFGKIRRGKFDANRAIARKNKRNSRQFVLGRRTANRHGIASSSIAGVDTCSIGSGSNCIMYLHGGTYVDPPTILHWRMLSMISSASGWRIVAPIYPRAPKANATVTVDSMYKVYQQLCSDSSITNMVVMGDSAGGGLALALCQYIQHMGAVQPSRMILLSPWLDVAMTNDDVAQYVDKDRLLRLDILRAYGGCYANNCTLPWLASPIGNISSGLAPIDIFVGSHELFLPDCLLAYQLAHNVGIPVRLYEFANMQHVFPLFPIPEAQEARNMIIDILEETK